MVKLRPEQIYEAQRLRANLVGDRDRMSRMGGFRLQPWHFPEEMEMEREVLSVLQQIKVDDDNEVANGGTVVGPTYENVKRRLQIFFGQDTPYVSELSDLLSKHAVDEHMKDSSIQIASMSLKSSIEASRYMQALEEAHGVVEAGVGGHNKAIVDAQKIISKALPSQFGGGKVDGMTQASIEFLGIMMERQEKVEKGEFVGPAFPFIGLTEDLGNGLSIPFTIGVGEMFVVSARSKFAKTTLALHLMKKWAHEQGYDVLYIGSENDGLNMYQRYIASELLIPQGVMRNGIGINWFDPDVARDINEAGKKFRRLNEEVGRINHVHLTDINMGTLEMYMADHAYAAEQRGRKFVFILDYFQNVNTNAAGQTDSTAAKYNWYANQLKNLIQNTRYHGLTFSQENEPKTEKGVEQQRGDAESRTRYGGAIVERGQAYITLEREFNNENETMPMNDPKTGHQRRDYLNRLMFWHQPSDTLKGRSMLKVRRVNEGRSGQEAVFHIGNSGGYFLVEDDHNLVTRKALQE